MAKCHIPQVASCRLRLHPNHVQILAAPMDHMQPIRSSVHQGFPNKNTEMGCHALLQGVLPTQGDRPCVSCIVYQLLQYG